uniref:Lectin-domain containing receptor kinase A4.2 n=1 Tax=Aegilops tauschii TaxID=37682 RepID=N1QVU2_AEGTA
MAASGAALCLSFVLLLVAVCCNSDVDFIYQGFQHAPNLSLDGSASVLRGGALQLTTGSERLVGHAFYGSPVALGTLDDSQSGGGLAVSSFSTAFVFDIVTVGTGGGHGLAFVVAPSRALPGASPEIYLGVLGPTTNGKASNHVFAVEFDTVTDLEMKETNGNHVGVDVNSLVSNVSEQAAYYTAENRKVPVKLESAQQIQAWIDYDGGTSLLNVTGAPVSVADRPQRPLISTKLDLRSVFKENMYVGFSSATGKLASSHYILAWSFRANGPAQPIDLRRLPKVPRQRTPAPKVLIIKFAAVACAGTLTLVAAAMVTVLWLRRRAALADKLEEWELEHPQRIPYIELYKATKGFRESGLLGSGGFGHVYKGVLGRRRSGEEVAIKRISSGTKQGMREFVAEISSLGRMRHRNLVELRGWCKHGNDLLLVYEFMPNGSLDAHLFGGGNKAINFIDELNQLNVRPEHPLRTAAGQAHQNFNWIPSAKGFIKINVDAGISTEYNVGTMKRVMGARWISTLAGGRAPFSGASSSFVRLCVLLKKMRQRRILEDGISFSLPSPVPMVQSLTGSFFGIRSWNGTPSSCFGLQTGGTSIYIKELEGITAQSLKRF